MPPPSTDSSSAPAQHQPQIAVIVPCLNEEAAIGEVVRDFKQALPDATIFVYDNGSTDRTAEIAAAAGAQVRREPLRGKGNVVRRMFADVDADIYVLVDGDRTYDAASAPRLVGLMLDERLDMVCGARVDDGAEGTYRAGHRFGNKLLTGLVARFFGDRIGDMLSGYRVFSRRFVKSFPAMASGFEIETEFTIHALELRMPLAEVPTPYGSRPKGSSSKLSTWRDGFRILALIFRLLRDERPLSFFSAIGGVLALASILLSIPILITYLETGLVPRFPTAILSTGLMLVAVVSFACGLILDTVTKGRREAKRLAYLAYPAPGAPPVKATD